MSIQFNTLRAQVASALVLSTVCAPITTPVLLSLAG
jgi:hypothetical protein